MKTKGVLTNACLIVAMLASLASMLLAYPSGASDSRSELAFDPQCPGGKPPPCDAKPTSSGTKKDKTASRTSPAKPIYSKSAKPKSQPSAAENAARGDDLFSQREYAAAEPFYREAVRLAPGNARYNNNLGVTLIGPQNSPEPTSLGELVKSDVVDYMNRELPRLKEAESYCRKALSSEPGNARYNNCLGRALYYQHDPAEAEPYFREAVHLEPSNADYNSHLGMALYNQQKYAEAEPHFRGAVRLSPNRAGMRYNLGFALYNLKQHAEAETQFREAVRLAPGNTKYQETLKRMKVQIMGR
jgi:Flp pilus assembly protein TadD